MELKISVIIPCYNLEDKIRDCIESISSQAYQNLEIIVVDDGSKDRSVDVIKEISKKDGRVILYSQENKGVSSARNMGIEHASGEFLMFVDGDDYIGRNYIKDLVSAVEKKSDMVIAGFRYVYPNGAENIIDGIEFNCTKNEFIEKHYLESVKRRLVFGPINKLYRRTLIDEKNIRFDENIAIREDGLFVLSFLQEANYFSGINQSEYYYVQNELSTSLVSKFQPREKELNELFFHELIDVIGEENLTDNAIDIIFPMYLNMNIASIRKLYGSSQYNLISGLIYIKSILSDYTFKVARGKLFTVNKKRAMKYYRPLILVHFINYTAIKISGGRR